MLTEMAMSKKFTIMFDDNGSPRIEYTIDGDPTRPARVCEGCGEEDGGFAEEDEDGREVCDHCGCPCEGDAETKEEGEPETTCEHCGMKYGPREAHGCVAGTKARQKEGAASDLTWFNAAIGDAIAALDTLIRIGGNYSHLANTCAVYGCKNRADSHFGGILVCGKHYTASAAAGDMMFRDGGKEGSMVSSKFGDLLVRLASMHRTLVEIRNHSTNPVMLEAIRGRMDTHGLFDNRKR